MILRKFSHLPNRIQQRPKRQRGFLMLEVGLALMIAFAASALAYQVGQRATDASNASNQAETLQFVRDAADSLVQENYIAYQAGAPITRNGVTLAMGTSPGEALNPTMANLKAMNLGVDQASDVGFYKSLASANYQIDIQRGPPGCNLAPNPANGVLCQIKGTVCFNAPVRNYGAAVGETDGFALGKMLGRLGGNGGITLEGTEATITGNGGSWSEPNPIAGAPAGIVCSRFGYGASGLANFLRVNDTRDPGFQGGATLDGVNASGNTLQVNGNTNLTGSINIGGATTIKGDIGVVDPATGTTCVKVYKEGQIDIDCNGVLNAKTGRYTAANGTVFIGDGNPAGLYVISTAGGIYAGKGLKADNGAGIYSTANPLGASYADRFTGVNGVGATTLAVHDIGRLGASESVGSGYLGLNRVVVAGANCGSAAAVVPATDAGGSASTALASLPGGGLATCINTKWTAIIQGALPGTACAPDGIRATSSLDGRDLICKNGVFMQMNDLLSSFVLMNTYRVTNGSVVAKPICGQMGAGFGQAIPVLTAQIESSTNASFTRRTDDASATQWVVVLQDSNGNALAGNPNAEALLYAYCYY